MKKIKNVADDVSFALEITLAYFVDVIFK